MISDEDFSEYFQRVYDNTDMMEPDDYMNEVYEYTYVNGGLEMTRDDEGHKFT